MLREENLKLKQLVADLSLDTQTEFLVVEPAQSGTDGVKPECAVRCLAVIAGQSVLN